MLVELSRVNNRILPSIYGKQPIAFKGVRGIPLANNLIRCNLSLELEVSFGDNV